MAYSYRQTNPGYTSTTLATFDSYIKKINSNQPISASDINFIISEARKVYQHTHTYLDYSYVAFGNKSGGSTTVATRSTLEPVV
jgi:hypothetical protein